MSGVWGPVYSSCFIAASRRSIISKKIEIGEELLTMAQSLKGKVAIVTGAARGIGKATAIALAKEGVNVGLLARNEAALRQVAAELEGLGVKAAYAVADVSSKEQVEAAIEAIKNELGSADILINNAGIATFGTVLEMDPEEWRRIIDTNLLGTYYATRAVLPQLIQKNGGDIINISSTSGLSGAATSSAYSASKFAVIGFTESLAQEVRRNNIRVSALNPSTVATDLALDLNLIKENNDSKFMQPEDIAEIIVNQLRLNPRIYVKTASFIATNPY
ncbi:3-oxoacyl-[acyl-carrier protein] reductase [Paenibacillus harenae]|nr:3-oxoacyl-[acyl-carrier protein] reductase [Paenibacillus harenae]